MRLFRRSRRTDHPNAPTSGEPSPGVVVERPPHPDRSRPRADWAKLEPIRSATKPPPVTFDGARFGRSVAGARSITAADRPHRRHRGPSGIAIGLTSDEHVLVPDPGAEPESPSVDPASDASPVSMHRKAAAVRVAEQRLTVSDMEPSFAPVLARGALDPATSTSWTIDTGFGGVGLGAEPANPTDSRTDDAVPAELRGMRVIRPRRDTADAGPPDETDIDTNAVPGEPAVQSEPAVRYLPTTRPRPRHDPTASPPVTDEPAIPGDVIAAVRAATGSDVGDARIDRSAATTGRARSVGAVAFTEQGTVHLPAELGDLDDPSVRSIVAHELTHVAQQRARGAEMPAEDSDEGRDLERQAQQVQRAVYDGDVVTPTFLRRREPESLGPTGVQRLTHPDWHGDDWSDVDLSGVEPGGERDPFGWQARTDEPDTGAWDDRREWARDFEDEHAAQLQHLRDRRFGELVDGAAAGQTLDDTALQALRAQLDREMPYQFGPPQGVEPYPEQAASVTSDPASPAQVETTPAAAGGDVLAPQTQTLPVVTTRSPTQPLAEPALIHRVTLLPGARSDAPATPTPAGAKSGFRVADAGADAQNLTGLTRQRLDRERELRQSVLADKRERATALGVSTDVELTSDEVSQIRLLVDLEHPSGEAFPQYLDDDEDTIMTADGQFASTGTRESGAQPDAATPLDPASDLQLRTSPASGEATGLGLQQLTTDLPTRPQVDAVNPALDQPPDLDDVQAVGGESRDPLAHPDLDRSPYADSELASLIIDSMSDIDLEVLTRRLYRRMRTHIRHELLIDRERSGVLADVR